MIERRSLAVVALLVLGMALPRLAGADAVVGTGTADSCTEAALNKALGCGAPSGSPPRSTCTAGGSIAFDCGTDPVTITVTSSKIIAANAGIDGGGLITLSGGGEMQLFSINSWATLTLTSLTVSGSGVASLAGDPAIRNYGGRLTVANSTFANNYGPIYNGCAVVVGEGCNGAGTLTVSNSTFANNTGGAILNYGAVTVTDTTFANNPDAILNGFGTVTVTNSTFVNNYGAIQSYSGTVMVTSSTFVGNTDGAIYNGDSLAVTDSTFAGNSADHGSAIENNGGSQVTATITNSTFAGNDAIRNGGAIYNAGMLRVTNCTFSRNYAGGSGGAIYNYKSAIGPAFVATLANTVVANSASGGNCSGTITDGGHNLDSDETCGVGPPTDPMLDPAGLADNGGLTQTVALQAGSPAIDSGDEGICDALPVSNLDQRRFIRPGIGAVNCSIGAYEYNSRGSSDCCQCPLSCAAPINGSCGGCTLVFEADCMNGDLCVLHAPTPTRTITPTPSITTTPSGTSTPTATRTPTVTPTFTRTPTVTSTATNTPGTNDCCQCADFCAAPIVGTCGGCTVVLGASCTGGYCISRTPPTPTSTPQTATVTVTPTQTPTGTWTPTPSRTVKPAPTLTTAATNAPTLTNTPTTTGTPTRTPTQTPTNTWTSTATFTSTRTPTVAPSNTPTVTTVPTATAPPTLTPRPCIGDCNDDGTVTIDDILTMVNIALGNAHVDDCLAGDVNDDGQITVDEILMAVSNALNGCPKG